MVYAVSESPHAPIEALPAASKPRAVAEVRDYHQVATWNNNCLAWEVRDPISR